MTPVSDTGSPAHRSAVSAAAGRRAGAKNLLIRLQHEVRYIRVTTATAPLRRQVRQVMVSTTGKHLSQGAGAEAGCKLGKLQFLAQCRCRCRPTHAVSGPHPLHPLSMLNISSTTPCSMEHTLLPAEGLADHCCTVASDLRLYGTTNPAAHIAGRCGGSQRGTHAFATLSSRTTRPSVSRERKLLPRLCRPGTLPAESARPLLFQSTIRKTWQPNA